MERIELKVLDIVDRVSTFPGLYILLLKEVDGTRKLPIVIGLPEAQAIAFSIHRVRPKRPTTHDLFVTFSETYHITLCEVLIYKILGGTFYSYLMFEDENGYVQRVDSRTSDAVALALRYEAKIYVSRILFEDFSMDNEKSSMLSIPLSNVDTESLKAAMANAVKEENYELASKLRDELKLRGELK